MILFVILQRDQAHWQELPDPFATLSSIIIFFNMFLKLRGDNRIVVVSGGVIFDSSSHELSELVGRLRHAKDAPLRQDMGYVLCLTNVYQCKSRVLLVTFETDKDVLRCIFSAQKLGIRIDSVSFDNSEVVKQAATITGGIYWRGEPLNTFFLKMLGSRVETQPIDFTTSCTCHDKRIMYGLVCPICLAVYCQVVPVCKKCKIRFEFQ